MKPVRRISIYVHVPFCKRRCSYCTFYHVDHAERFESNFVRALEEELRDAAARIGEPFVAPTVFFGGGTPSVLAPRSLEALFRAIDPFLPADRSAEITCEVNPEDVTEDLLARLSSLGVNRVSVGIQSMDPQCQRILRRCAPPINARALELVARRFDNRSVDLLLGIPGGSADKVRSTLEAVAGFGPKHFSVYCLEPGGDMPEGDGGFFAGVDPERSADEYSEVCRYLAGRGLVHYEVSNFAVPGCECRHNRVYWEGGDYVGLGPGAHSCVGGERSFNEPSIERYVESGPAVRRTEARGPDERELEGLMLSLRTSRGIPLDALSGKEPAVSELIGADLARQAGGRLSLTDQGFLLLNEIVLRLCGGARGPSGRVRPNATLEC